MFNELWHVDFEHKTLGHTSLGGMRKPTNDDEVQSLKKNGVVGIISMLDDTENHDLYQNNDMSFLWLAVKGGGAPSSEQVNKANEYITHQLSNSSAERQTVATHCNGGRKRTGTLLAGVMVLNGVDPEIAISKVETANPEIKLSEAQREFLTQLV